MTTGRSNKLVGATGEYLVAAELSRRGLIATTFTGNVPHYDIVASDETGRHVSVQVKASRGPSWQFSNISLYCEITFDGKKQTVGKKQSCPVRRLIMVFVRIDEDGTRARGRFVKREFVVDGCSAVVIHEVGTASVPAADCCSDRGVKRGW